MEALSLRQFLSKTIRGGLRCGILRGADGAFMGPWRVEGLDGGGPGFDRVAGVPSGIIYGFLERLDQIITGVATLLALLELFLVVRPFLTLR